MKVLLIDDHPIVRAGCRRLLEQTGRIDVTEAQSGAEALELLPVCGPDVIILDLNLPDASGLDLLQTLRAQLEGARVLVFSMHEDPVFAARALELGARGYVTKNDDPETIVEALDRVAAGEVFLSHNMAQRVALMGLKVGDNPLHRLTHREIEVLRLLGQGKSLSEIADQLNISYRTAANIQSQIKNKLNVGTTSKLIRIAIEFSAARM
jgi:DNA-binding NarL/FixJ family response regulator